MSLRSPGAVLLISCYELGHQPLGVALPLGFLHRAGFAPDALDISVDRFDEDRIYLMGESWGAALGIMLVQRFPELFHAYIGTAQMVAFLENDTMEYRADLARAHTVAGVVFRMPELLAGVSVLDTTVEADIQTQIRLEGRRITERATRWLLVNRRSPIDSSWEIGFFEEPISRLLVALPDLLVGRELDTFTGRRDALLEAGVPAEVLRRAGIQRGFEPRATG